MLYKKEKIETRRDIVIFGHRGYAEKFPENTIISFEKAFEYGADGIELDVRLTKDNKVVVIHDKEISRVSNGKGKVKDLKLSELRKYNFAVNNNTVDFASIPTLEDVLEILPPHVWLNIEFKEVEVVKPTIAILKHINPDRLILSSFLLGTLESAKAIAPQYKRGVIFDEKSEELFEMDQEAIFKKLDKYEPYSFHLPIKSTKVYPKEKILIFLDNVENRAIKSILWTCDIEEEIDKIVKHIDGIVTNKVERMVNHLRS